MFLVILIMIVLVSLAVGYIFARLIIYPRVFPFQETYDKMIEWGQIDEADYHSWRAEEFTIRSPYGYDLFAIYHPVAGSRKTMVFSHGITWSLYGMIKYAGMFYRRGWNVLVYDLRHHGRSGGKNTTFGYYEKYDLKAVVDWAFERLGEGGEVATMGESLGASTTLQHAAIDPRIAFAIADCSYSMLDDLLAYRQKAQYHLPRLPFLPLANLFCKLLTGMTFDKASPLPCIPDIETPIFFIHGQEDDYIPPGMSEAMYEAKQKGVRKLYLAPNAGHAQSYWNNRQEYEQKVAEFLQMTGIPVQ